MNEDPFKPIVLKDFSGGLVTSREADDLASNESPDLQNVDFDGRGSFQIRRGYKLFGDRVVTTGSITVAHTFKRAILGDEIPVRQNGATLEYYHTGTGEWESLPFVGTSTGTFGFVDFTATTDTVDYMYFCDGVVELQRWTGGHTLLNGALSGGEATIPVDSTTGFPTSGTITIGGTDVTYSGVTAVTFTGCTGTPAAADNAPVVDKAVDYSESAGTKPVGNIMTVVNRQLAVVEDQSILLSDTNDFTTWTGGNSDSLSVGGKLTALTTKDDALIAFTNNAIYAITYEYTSDLTGFQIRSDIVEDTPGYGALQFRGVTRADGEIFYVGGDNLIRKIVRSPVSALLDTGSISENIRDTLLAYTLTNAKATFFQNKLYFAVQSDQTNVNDTVLVFDLKYAKGNNTGEAWTKYSMYVNDFFVYGGALYFASSAEPNCFRMFEDSNGDEIVDDDGAAIVWYYKTPQFDFDRPYKKYRFKKFFSRGFISENSVVDYTAYYNYGTASEQEQTLNGTDDTWVSVPALGAVVGEGILGEEPLADQVDPFNGFYPFNYVTDYGTLDFYNMQVKIAGQTKDEKYKQTRLVLYIEAQDDQLTN